MNIAGKQLSMMEALYEKERVSDELSKDVQSVLRDFVFLRHRTGYKEYTWKIDEIILYLQFLGRLTPSSVANGPLIPCDPISLLKPLKMARFKLAKIKDKYELSDIQERTYEKVANLLAEMCYELSN
jgi:hypothetical protein